VYGHLHNANAHFFKIFFQKLNSNIMAHNINFNEQTGQHSFFSVKEKAWHGLGQIVTEYPNSAEALKFAGLDYTVEKRKLFIYDNKNDQADAENEIKIPEIEVPDYSATIRTDTEQVLGVVGKDYQIIQNTEAFSFFDAIVGGEGIQYETAGALGKGERIFITAKLPDYIKVGNDDLIEKYLFLTTSHDGFGSITAAFTPVRIICQNTLHAAMRNSTNSIKIRHTQSAKERLEEAHKVMGISNKLSEQLGDIFNHWAKVSITDAEVKKLIELAMAPSKEVLHNLHSGKLDELSTNFKNICSNVFEYGMSSPTQQTDTTKGTLFGAYNSITGYFQNVRAYKNDEAKLKSIMYGTGSQRTQRAFDLCEDFMKNGIDIFTLN
jgi:phage/plasmid-like protein (TIGR03299 family)